MADAKSAHVALLPAKERPRLSLGTYVAFTMLGLGQGWLSSDALFQQVPQFQRTQPEGAALAAYMGGATTAGSMLSLCVVALLTVLHVRTSQLVEDASVACMIFATVACLLCGAVGWDATATLPPPAAPALLAGAAPASSHSVAILALAFFSGAIGALRMAISMPWHLRYDPRLISANLLGGTVAALLVAALSAIQQPGGACRFGPSAFLALVSLLSIPSAAALSAIRYWKLGELAPRAEPPTQSRAPAARRAPSLHDFHGLDRPALPALAADEAAELPRPSSRPAHTPPLDAAAAAALRPTCARLPGWAPRALALGGAYVLAQSLVWGVTPGVLPYAAAHASALGARPLGLNSHELLALCMQASFLGLFVGAAAALAVDVHAHVGATFALIGLNSAVPLAFALDLHGRMRGTPAAIALVLSCTAARGLEGFVVPAIFRTISSDEAYGESRAAVQRALVIGERLATTAGSICTLALVTRVLDREGVRPSDDE
ncbi:hypothetical protein KFE25_006527 [Diacronema lutheri]|uniref:Uncharacterized protein n=2 Tax=Diacronema lutheri TaxID=2081491 RepID=A0A8J5X9D3_DIALT|nr:hypothetical protein KFE25_006527 [Diacronema lutheri]